MIGTLIILQVEKDKSKVKNLIPMASSEMCGIQPNVRHFLLEVHCICPSMLWQELT